MIPLSSPLRRPLLLASCLAALSSTALAVSDNPEADFLVADTDFSETLTLTEYATTLGIGVSTSAANRSFKKGDLDPDGVLTYFEYLIRRGVYSRPSKIELEFLFADDARDGLLTFEEFISTASSKLPWVEIKKRFIIADTNQNGNLLSTEYEAYRKGQAKAPAGVSLLKFDLADLDENNELELDEFAWTVPPATATAKLEAKFNKLDKNDDGVLTRNEWNPGAPKQR